MAITAPALTCNDGRAKKTMLVYQWYEATRDGMLDTKVIGVFLRVKKTALAANLTQEQICAARDRADKWIQAVSLV